MDDKTKKILFEKDPYLREIWAAGYTDVRVDSIDNKMLLLDEDARYVKGIHLQDYRYVCGKLTIIRGTDLAGGYHDWISNADGSLAKFKELIKRID